MTLQYHTPSPDIARAARMRSLRVISALHFFMGGVTGLAFLFLTLRVAAMSSGPPLAQVGRVAGVFLTLGAASFLFVFLGSAMRRPAAHGACLAATLALALFFPLGTAMAALTYWQLRRPDVRELFRVGTG